jgi:hypothetical protein
MEIQGKVIEVKKDRVCIITRDKKQEIDIFFIEKKFKAIDAWLEPHMFTKIKVEAQSIESDGVKLAKFWFVMAIHPEPQKEIFIGASQPLRNLKNLVLTLFPKDFDSAK